jgi:hypothetical protein
MVPFRSSAATRAGWRYGRQTSADLAVAAASLLVAVVSGIYTAASYYQQRKPLRDVDQALAVASRLWQARLGVAATLLAAVGMIDLVTAVPVGWIQAGMNAARRPGDRAAFRWR